MGSRENVSFGFFLSPSLRELGGTRKKVIFLPEYTGHESEPSRQECGQHCLFNSEMPRKLKIQKNE